MRKASTCRTSSPAVRCRLLRRSPRSTTSSSSCTLTCDIDWEGSSRQLSRTSTSRSAFMTSRSTRPSSTASRSRARYLPDTSIVRTPRTRRRSEYGTGGNLRTKVHEVHTFTGFARFIAFTRFTGVTRFTGFTRFAGFARFIAFTRFIAVHEVQDGSGGFMRKMMFVALIAIGIAAAGRAFDQDAAAIKKGQSVYTAQKCQTCHAIAGKGNKNNALDGVGTKLKADEIKEWITNPTEMTAKTKSTKKPPMPNKYSKLPAADLDGLVAYMQSLK